MHTIKYNTIYSSLPYLDLKISGEAFQYKIKVKHMLFRDRGVLDFIILERGQIPSISDFSSAASIHVPYQMQNSRLSFVLPSESGIPGPYEGRITAKGEIFLHTEKAPEQYHFELLREHGAVSDVAGQH